MRVALLVLAACGRDAIDAGIDARALPADLVLYYPMDEAIASGTLRDATGRRDGHCTGGSCPTAYEGGLIDGAMWFDGDDMIRIMSSAELDSLTEYTVTMFVGYAPGTGPSCLMGKRAGTTDGNTWQLCVNGNDNITLTSFDGTSNVITNTPSTLTGSWTPLALTWNATTQTEAFYFGGDFIGSQTITKVWDSGELLIGGDVDSDTPTAFLHGDIDDVRVYSRVLSAAELHDIAGLRL